MMDDNKITYQVLFDTLRDERQTEQLKTLEDTFYNDVQAYLAHKAQHVVDECGRTEFGNIVNMVRKIHERRQKKIVCLAVQSVQSGSTITANMLPSEKPFFDTIKVGVSENRLFLYRAVLPQKLTVAGGP